MCHIYLKKKNKGSKAVVNLLEQQKLLLTLQDVKFLTHIGVFCAKVDIPYSVNEAERLYFTLQNNTFPHVPVLYLYKEF